MNNRFTSRPGSSYGAILCILLFSLGGTSFFWLALRPNFLNNPTSDFATLSPDYSGIVRDLINGKGIVSFRYPPLFPLMLANIYQLAGILDVSDRILLAMFILACTGLSSTLLYLVSRKFWNKTYSFIVAVGWMTYPPSLFMASYVLSETPFTTLLLAGMLLFLDGLYSDKRCLLSFFACGILLGLAMLTRPIAMGLGFLLALLVCTLYSNTGSRRYIASWSAMILLGNLITVAPWEIYAFSRTGTLIPLSTGGTPSMFDGLTYAVDPKDHRCVTIPDDVRTLQQDIFERQYKELRTTRQILTYLKRQVYLRPAAVIKLFAIKAADCWYRSDSTRWDSLILKLQIPYLFLFLGSTIAALRLGGIHRKATILAWTVIVYAWVMATVVLSILRYLVPFIGLLFVIIPALFSRFASDPLKTQHRLK